MPAIDRIAARVKLNPDYTDLDSDWVEELVARAQSIVVGYCGLDSFPDTPDECPSLEDAAVILTEVLAAKQGLEGMGSGTLPHGVMFNTEDMDPRAAVLMNSRRRLWASP